MQVTLPFLHLRIGGGNRDYILMLYINDCNRLPVLPRPQKVVDLPMGGANKMDCYNNRYPLPCS